MPSLPAAFVTSLTLILPYVQTMYILQSLVLHAIH
jgi:hypothetical protein